MSKLIKKWITENNLKANTYLSLGESSLDKPLTELQLRNIIYNADPDCNEAKLIVDFAKFAGQTINDLEHELEIYRKHAENCNIEGI